MMSASSVRTDAMIIGNAAFLLPLNSTLPRSGTPPRMIILSIGIPPFAAAQVRGPLGWTCIVPKRSNEGTQSSFKLFFER
jgi:hypothetical protein